MTDTSGQTEKAKIVPLKDGTSDAQSTTLDEIEFMFNPATVKWSIKAKWDDAKDSGSDSSSKTFAGSDGRQVTLSNIWFDTFESRQNVRTEHIDKLERLIQRDNQGDHSPPYVLFVWGAFLPEADDYNSPTFKVESVDVEYKMFLPNGTPVRAVCSIALTEATPKEKQQYRRPNQSPDHAKLVTFRRGDTLQNVAYRAYDNASQWRRIAEVNQIDDPLNIAPGTQLLIPPILK